MGTTWRIPVTVGTVLLMTMGIAVGENIMAKQLLDSTKRQSEWTNIVNCTPKDAFVDGEEAWQEHLDATVTHVIECPQPQGDPMYAVFLGGTEGKAQGWFALVAPEGKLIGHACDGNNVVEPTDIMADINADGVVEFVSNLPGQPVVSGGRTNDLDVLLVIPILTVQKPNFVVIFNRRPQRQSLLAAFMPDNYAEVQNWIHGRNKMPVRPKHLGKDRWFWKLAAPHTARAEIQLGPLQKDQLAPKATFRWSEQQKNFVGPNGSPEEGFTSSSDGEWYSQVEAFCAGAE